jgi:hypothetical protein
LILAHAGRPLPGGELRWQVRYADGRLYAEGGDTIAGPLHGGRPRSLLRFALDMPRTEQALSFQLEGVLETGMRTVRNRWNLWVFPEVAAWPEGVALLDPTGSLSGLDDLYASAQRVDAPTPTARVLLSSVLTDDVIAFVRGGGSVLLLQNGDGPLPAVMRSFWPNAIKIIGDHPVMNAMPHTGFVDMQFYGLGTDWALDTGQLSRALPGMMEMRSLLRRLDTGQFTVADYLIEAQLGAGTLIASTLRFQGGMGDQPFGLRGQVAGRWLLYLLLQRLCEPARASAE